MKISKLNLLKLGVFIILGILIFVAAVYYLGRQQNIFRSGMSVYTEFYDVKGLQIGNNVRYLGTYAGYVSSIRIISDTLVRVEMVIDHRMSEFIRENSNVEIQNDGVMGSKIMVIHPGTPDYPTIRANSMLPSLRSMSIEEIFGALEGTVAFSTRAAENLWIISESIKDGGGVLGKLLYDPQMARTMDELGENLLEVSKDVSEILMKLQATDNDLGKFLNEENINNRLMQVFNELDTMLLNLSTSSEEIKKATQAINHDQGIFNKLLYDSAFAGELDTTVVKLNTAIEEITQTSEVVRKSWIFRIFSSKRE